MREGNMQISLWFDVCYFNEIHNYRAVFEIIILSETIMGSTHPQAIKPLLKPALLFIEIIYINSESFIVMIISAE